MKKDCSDYYLEELKNLQYVLLPGKLNNNTFISYYEKAYTLWKNVWKDTFLELDGDDTLFSNDFTRQDHIGALFEGDKCIMLSFFRNVDLKTSPPKDDSYFKVWSEKNLSELCRDGTNIIVGSNITLAPEVRGSNHILPLKDLVLAMSVCYLLHSNAITMTGTTRNNKGVNAAMQRVGGALLESNKILHNVKVDLMAFYKKDILKKDSYYLKELSDYLWANHIDCDIQTRKLKAA